MIGARWTVRDDAHLLTDVSLGVSYKRIAQKLERTRTACLQRGRILGADYRRRRWNDREDADLRRLLDAGMNYREIAGRFGRTPNAIGVRACILGLTNTRKEIT